MSDQYVGEIRMFAGRYAPLEWVFCDGRLLSINDNQLLYALLGTTYGGDGRSTFAVPDLRGKLAVHQGQGPNLTPRVLAQSFGSTVVPLNESQIPSHTHAFNTANNPALLTSPSNNLLAAPAPNTVMLYATVDTSKPMTTMNTSMIAMTDPSNPHDNMMPTLCVNFIIATQGLYPEQP